MLALPAHVWAQDANASQQGHGGHTQHGGEQAMLGGHEAHGGMMGGMASSTDLLDPMSQEASGTAWLPSTTPMYGRMYMHGMDMLMVHGDIHLRYTDVGSKRGDRRIDAPNWFMAMYSHPLSAKEQIGLRGMFSLDPLTEGGNGYPLLFQTGETWHGNPLHDRQHPHDLVAEMAAAYSRKVATNVSASLYAGYPGEPALGPPTYMHRPISYDLADAPIGHHWQDATHITMGVLTAGVNFASRWKIEGSVFNGREPDENRYLPDRLRLDSYSGRVSYNPNGNHAFQLSYGFVNNPEGDGVPQHRVTASWLYNRPLGEDANFHTALVFGQNLLPKEGRSSSWLLDADYERGRDTYFARIEQIQKSGAELVLPIGGRFDLGEFTVGYIRDIRRGGGIDTGLGAAVTLNTKPGALDPYYGRGTPASFQLFLRFKPSRMDHAGHAGHMTMDDTGGLKVTAAFAGQATTGGHNALTVTVEDASGRPVTGAKVEAAVNMTTMDMGTSRPAFKESAPGRYVGDVGFSMAGPWRVTLRITPPGASKPAVKTVDVNVGR